jgi:hypothetical protein
MTSDEKATLFAISFWCIFIISSIVLIISLFSMGYNKTVSFISSYKEVASKENNDIIVIKNKKKLPVVDAPKTKVVEKDYEYNLMFDEYGDLRDPVPGDSYTASQNYWVLILAILVVFFLFGGVCMRIHPIVTVFIWIFTIILACVVSIW